MEEYTLFQLSAQTSFGQSLHTLRESDLLRIAGSTIYNRGQQYYQSGAVATVEITPPDEVCVEVTGSDTYNVTLRVSGNRVMAACTCPYEAVCKHIVAALLHLKHDTEAEDFTALTGLPDSPATPEDSFARYLDRLPPAELKALILQFAPPSFREAIRLKYADVSERSRILDKVRQEIRRLFKSQLIYEIHAFEEKLMVTLEKLRGTWESHSAQVKDLLVDTIKMVNDCFEEGGLYGYTSYGSDEYYTGDRLTEYLIEFFRTLPPEQKNQYLPEIWAAITDMGYTTFTGFTERLSEYISPPDKPLLKSYFLSIEDYGEFSQATQRAIYEQMKEVLSEPEKRFLLEELAPINNSLVLELSRYHQQRKVYSQAIQVLEDALKSNGNEPLWNAAGKAALYEERIELARQSGQPVNYWVKEYLHNLPIVATLRKAIHWLPDQQSSFEAYLAERNTLAYITYLEEENRLDEVVATFQSKQLDRHTQYEFYKRHKEKYAPQALAVFESVLYESLEHASSTYYTLVIEALTHLQKLMPASEFRLLLESIRTQSKRRRTFIQMLNQQFGA